MAALMSSVSISWSFAPAFTGVDKIVPRDGTPDRWTRTLEVSIPVRNRETWVATSAALAEAVSFLTGDNWSFEFTNAPRDFSQRRANRRVHAKGFPKSP